MEQAGQKRANVFDGRREREREAATGQCRGNKRVTKFARVMNAAAATKVC